MTEMISGRLGFFRNLPWLAVADGEGGCLKSETRMERLG
jgi:hypothetical protein